MSRSKRVNFKVTAEMSVKHATVLVPALIGNGCLRGHEWIARNPKRDDHKPGSFCVNMRTGRWADFATGDKGGDLISLAAYLHNTTQIEAAKSLARWMGIYDQ